MTGASAAEAELDGARGEVDADAGLAAGPGDNAAAAELDSARGDDDADAGLDTGPGDDDSNDAGAVEARLGGARRGADNDPGAEFDARLNVPLVDGLDSALRLLRPPLRSELIAHSSHRWVRHGIDRATQAHQPCNRIGGRGGALSRRHVKNGVARG